MNRRYAALTMVRDEHFFLQFWYQYYAGQFGPENCYVIDHNSQAVTPREVVPELSSVFRLPFENLEKDQDEDRFSFDRRRFWLISKQIEALLEIYDVVIFNDCDEIYVVDPRLGKTLPEYLNSLPEVGVRTGAGIEVMHDPATEPEFDLEKPIFEQRQYFRYLLRFSKPWIVSKPCKIGGHGVSCPFTLDPNLLMLHCRYLDATIGYMRQMERQVLFEKGRSGKRARWKFTPEHFSKTLKTFAKQPSQTPGLPHSDVFSRWWPDYSDKVMSPEHFPQREDIKWGYYSLVNFKDNDSIKAFEALRCQFPKEFSRS